MTTLSTVLLSIFWQSQKINKELDGQSIHWKYLKEGIFLKGTLRHEKLILDLKNTVYLKEKLKKITMV